ncbi:MAG: right-handed parallel beta-helix repeat-containing protein [Chloroflexi bacterium]|nr:right-handed parallel beta-helix repeat-containing protein [Chloroflexota bacterium]
MHATINRIGWLVAGILALSVVASMTGVVSGGPLDPPGPPAPILPQVEPRSPIPPVGWDGTFPITISQPGSYFFTRSVTTNGANHGIEITASDVSIDLNGFTLRGLDLFNTGIRVIGQRSGIHISNGVIREWNIGIDGWSPDGEAVYSRVDHITALDNSDGIRLGFDSEIVDCNASNNSLGIITHYGVVRGCHVTDNTNYGIYAEDVSLIEGNKVWNNDFGIVVTFSGAQPGNNTVRSNTATNNTTADINFNGTGNVSDNNVTTCPDWVTGTAKTYSPKFQRDVC